MAVRFYLMPIEVVNTTYRGPKYLKWRFGTDANHLDVPWSMYDYGAQDTALVCADVTPGQHSTLNAQVDVQAVPADIDTTIAAGALTATRNALESLWIPGNWVTTEHTWRQVLRVVAGLFQFAMKYQTIVPDDPQPLMTGTPNFNLTLRDLSAARRQRLQATADAFGYDTSELSLDSTLRDVLRFLGEKWGTAPFYFGSPPFTL